MSDKKKVGRTEKFEFWLYDEFYCGEWKDWDSRSRGGRYVASGPHRVKGITIDDSNGTQFYYYDEFGETQIHSADEMFTMKSACAAHLLIRNPKTGNTT